MDHADRASGRQRGVDRRGLRQGLRVLITGGAAGIGLEIATACHEDGARVHVCDVNEAMLGPSSPLPSEIGRTVADVSKHADVDRLFQDVVENLSGLDVLVNNAAITGPGGPIETNDPEAWSRTIEVNLIGQFLCIRRAIPLLREAGGGSIVNIASIAGRLGYPTRTAYAASKWAIIGLTQSVAMEVGESNIRVNAILPGIVSGARQALVQNE